MYMYIHNVLINLYNDVMVPEFNSFESICHDQSIWENAKVCQYQWQQ